MSCSPSPPASSPDTPPERRRWQMGFSGGGLRSCSSSAVFALAAMHTHPPFPDTASTSLWDTFSRLCGVSGGAWFLAALGFGSLRPIAPSTQIDELISLLCASGIICSFTDTEKASRSLAMTRALARRMPSLTAGAVNDSVAGAMAASLLFRFGDGAYIAVAADSTTVGEKNGDDGVKKNDTPPLLELYQDYLCKKLGLANAPDFGASKPDGAALINKQTWICSLASSSSSSSSSADATQLASSSSWLAFCLNEHRVRQIDVSRFQRLSDATQVVPLEPISLARMMAFCGSAFSATGSEVLEQAAGSSPLVKSASTLLSSLTSYFGGAASSSSSSISSSSYLSSFVSNQLLGEETVDHCVFASPAVGSHAGGGTVSMRLRDAGLDANIPFIFSDCENVVQFVLDSGSGATQAGAIAHQIEVSQRKGHLGKYTCVMSSMMKYAQERAVQAQQHEKRMATGNDDDDSRTKSDAVAEVDTAEKIAATLAYSAALEKTDPNWGSWSIYLKDIAAERGPPIVVYLHGINAPQTMEVETIPERIAALKSKYDHFLRSLKFITEFLIERGF